MGRGGQDGGDQGGIDLSVSCLRALALCLLLLPSPAALAIDPGRALGELRIRDQRIPLTHAYALLHEAELRVVVADREIPQSALAGRVELPVEALAKAGEVRGLLVRADPRNRARSSVTVLDAGALPFAPIDAPGVLRKLGFANNRALGLIEGRVPRETEYRVEFSAPLFHER